MATAFWDGYSMLQLDLSSLYTTTYSLSMLMDLQYVLLVRILLSPTNP